MPDATIIWLFCEQLTQATAMEKLFRLFDRRLQEDGHLAKSGQILDMSLIPAPCQHLLEDEKAAIKEGQIG